MMMFLSHLSFILSFLLFRSFAGAGSTTAEPTPAGLVVEEFNRLFHKFVAEPDAVKEVLADDGVGCFNGECIDSLHDMYIGSIGGAEIFDYETEYFTVTENYVLMRCWDFLKYKNGCTVMFFADSLITVKDGKIVKHEVFSPKEEMDKLAACQTAAPSDEEEIMA